MREFMIKTGDKLEINLGSPKDIEKLSSELKKGEVLTIEKEDFGFNCVIKAK